MTPFGYLVVFLSLVLALSVTRILTGLGQLLQAARRDGDLRLHWVHLAWVFTVLLILINYWWTIFQLRGREQWFFFEFLALLLAPILFYLQAVVLFPEPGRLEEGFDFRRYFYDQHRVFFALMSAMAALNFLYSYGGIFEAERPVTALGVGSMLFTLGVMVGGAITDNEVYHGALAVLSLVFSAGLSLAASGQAVIG